MRSPLGFPAPPDRPGFRWYLGSALVHVVFVVWLLLTSGPSGRVLVSPVALPQRTSFTIVQLPPLTRTPSAAAMPGGGGAGGSARTAEPVRQPPPAAAVPVTSPETVPEPDSGAVAAAPGKPVAREREEGLGISDELPPGQWVTGPRFGDGQLWVRPIDSIALPAVVVERAEDLDSIFVRRLRELVNQLPPDSFAIARKPSWKTRRGGKTWGIDDKFIYLGDIKIPIAALAALPLGGYGNYYQIKDAQQLQRMREDIIRNARRIEDRAKIRSYIAEIRARKNRERLEQKGGQKAKVARRDTIIPGRVP